MSKRCNTCGELKEYGEFHRNASRPDGLSGTCKDCQRAYVRSHYQRNRATYLAKAAKRNLIEREKTRALIRELKAVPCAGCGVQYESHVMQFDHVRGVKLFEVGLGVWLTRKRILEEAAKCEVVCANCHADRTYRRLMRARSSAD